MTRGRNLWFCRPELLEVHSLGTLTPGKDHGGRIINLEQGVRRIVRSDLRGDRGRHAERLRCDGCAG